MSEDGEHHAYPLAWATRRLELQCLPSVGRFLGGLGDLPDGAARAGQLRQLDALETIAGYERPIEGRMRRIRIAPRTAMPLDGQGGPPHREGGGRQAQASTLCPDAPRFLGGCHECSARRCGGEGLGRRVRNVLSHSLWSLASGLVRMLFFWCARQGALLRVEVSPQVDHGERNEARLRVGDRAWGVSVEHKRRADGQEPDSAAAS
jgi:hypothetical protein